MAKETMQETDDGMDELYSSDRGKTAPETIDQEETEEMGEQATVPLKVLMGKHTEPLKEGDEVVLKIDKISGDQAIVSYSETPPSEIGKGEEGEGPEEMSADDELDELGKQY